MEEFLKSVQVEASLYGMALNMVKTEILAENGSTPPVYFVDGTPVPASESVKYLGSHITWSNPTNNAIDARKACSAAALLLLGFCIISSVDSMLPICYYSSCYMPAAAALELSISFFCCRFAAAFSFDIAATSSFCYCCCFAAATAAFAAASPY